MRMIFMGTPQAVSPVLESLCRQPDAEVIAAITPPDRQRGRGRHPEPPPVKEAAQRLGVPVWQPPTLRSQEAQHRLTQLNPDIIVVAAYGHLLPPPVLQLPPHGCLNLHPSLLPRHRGPSPVAASILEGDQSTGVSLMLLDKGMDTGPIIAQRNHPLTGKETAGDLTNTLFALGADLLTENLKPWTQGNLSPHPQDAAQATISRKLERADGQADWRQTANALERQCRAYHPWPGLHTHWQNKTLKLLDVTPMPEADTGTAEPGQVIPPSSTKGLYIVTGQGILSCNRLQLEGRRPVTANEFLRGHPEITNARLGIP